MPNQKKEKYKVTYYRTPLESSIDAKYFNTLGEIFEFSRRINRESIREIDTHYEDCDNNRPTFWSS